MGFSINLSHIDYLGPPLLLLQMTPLSKVGNEILKDYNQLDILITLQQIYSETEKKIKFATAINSF